MVFVLAAATGLRCGELFALRLNDVDFKAGTIRVDESADQRTYKIGPCKNAAAYRTVLLADSQGKEALSMLKRFLEGNQSPSALVFRSKRGSPLRETNVLHESSFEDPRASTSRDAGVPSRLQSQMGVSRDESCRTAATDGTQLFCDDGKIHRRNSTRTGEDRVFQHGIGKYGKWRVCTRSRLVMYNQQAREQSGRRTMAV
jgi:Phage integrase family